MTHNELRVDGARVGVDKALKRIAYWEKRLIKREERLLALGYKLLDYSESEKRASNESYWEYCDLESDRESLLSAHKVYKESVEKLEKWQEKLLLEQQTTHTFTPIPLVEEFLLLWKSNSTEFYIQQVDALLAWESEHLTLSYLERIAYKRDHWSALVMEFATYSRNDFLSRLEKLLSAELLAKRNDFYTRCFESVGTLLDASNLTLASDASLNGLVIGELGKARIETIIAGGYNIQCLHYRVLVHKIRS
jgi:hypothetical protein